MRFGEYLREERKKQGLTVQAVAQSCGISRSYITLIESGKRPPREQILSKIADALYLKKVDVLNWYLEDITEKAKKSLDIP